MPARLYGLPKMHKVTQEGEMPPFRPIVSSIGSCNYKLAKVLGNMLRPLICTDYSCSDTFSFVKEIQSKNFDANCFMVSYDVQSLFTNIPLHETIDLAVDILLENKPDLKISRDNFVKLFHFATSKSQFLFDGEYFEQRDGVAMGSPLAPILANLFLGNYEGTWLSEYDGQKPTYYKRYVDDIIAVFDNENDAKTFLAYLNSKHVNIKFTMELENNKQLPFLDVLLDRSEGTLRTTTYRKQTFSGVLLNYHSFTPMSYKIGLVRCLIDRIFKINNTWMGFHLDLEKVFQFLKRNLYPERILNKVSEKYLNSKYVTNTDVSCREATNVTYFMLPYLGRTSIALKSKMKKICDKYKIKLNVKLAFQSFKLSNMLSTKDKLSLKSHVVYKFMCAGCNDCYVGYTTRHFSTRINEHLSSDKKSHVYKHLRNRITCLHACNESSFSIIDYASTEYKLKIKEAMHIKWLRPVINKQKKSYTMTLSV